MAIAREWGVGSSAIVSMDGALSSFVFDVFGCGVVGFYGDKNNC